MFAFALAAAITVLPPPDFKSKPVGAIAKPSGITLRQVSAKANEITDDDAWFERNELTLPRAIDDLVIQDGRYVVTPDYTLDFANYASAPQHEAGEERFANQEIVWARQLGDVLYVSHGHRTYARSSKGMNAYVTAIDTRTLKPLWHSAPLVSNASNFEVYGDYLITGYGFTAEPDFLYVLRRDTGKAVARIPVKSGPSWIIRKGDDLYVRTYNTDYVFRIVRLK